MKYIEKYFSTEKDLWPITVYIMQKNYMYFQIKRHPDHLGCHHHHLRRQHCHRHQQNHHNRNVLQTHYLMRNVTNAPEYVLMILNVKDRRSIVDTGVAINVSILCKI